MAYRRFRRFGRARRRFRSYGARGRRFMGGKGGGMIYTAGGIAAGMFAPNVLPLQDTIITAIAVLPVRMPRMIRRLTGGYVLGRLARPFVGGVIPGSTVGDGSAV